MQIIVNEQQRTVEPGTSLADIMRADFGSCPQGLAIAVNDAVVPRSCWETQQVSEQDRLLIVQAVQGG